MIGTGIFKTTPNDHHHHHNNIIIISSRRCCKFQPCHFTSLQKQSCCHDEIRFATGSRKGRERWILITLAESAPLKLAKNTLSFLPPYHILFFCFCGFFVALSQCTGCGQFINLDEIAVPTKTKPSVRKGQDGQ
jgi:hypothetical protein